MQFSQAIPLLSRPKFSEGTKLSSSRDDRNNAFLWKKGALSAGQLDATNQAIEKLSREFSKQRRKPLGGFVPQEPTNAFYPFKIYQPDISLITGQNNGLMIPNSSSIIGTRDTCGFDPTLPTVLTGAGPYNCNPKTDAWRIWAIRDGFYSVRNYTQIDFQDVTGDRTFNVLMPDYSEGSTTLSLALSDLYNGTDGQGIDYDIEPGSNPDNPIYPIVLVGNADSIGFYNFAIWLEVYPSSPGVFGGIINGAQFDSVTGMDSAFPSPPFPGETYIGGYTIFPLGVITSTTFLNQDNIPTNLFANQIQFGNCYSNYGEFNNSSAATRGEALLYSSGLNYRGDFINDTLLAETVFYPGDVVKIQQQIVLTATSTGGIATTIHAALAGETTSSSLFVQSLYLCTTIGFTSDPTTDSDWVKISGIDVETQTSKTPNTLL